MDGDTLRPASYDGVTFTEKLYCRNTFVRDPVILSKLQKCFAI